MIDLKQILGRSERIGTDSIETDGGAQGSNGAASQQGAGFSCPPDSPSLPQICFVLGMTGYFNGCLRADSRLPNYCARIAAFDLRIQPVGVQRFEKITRQAAGAASAPPAMHQIRSSC